jgi:hypothetical protein
MGVVAEVYSIAGMGFYASMNSEGHSPARLLVSAEYTSRLGCRRWECAEWEEYAGGEDG